MPTPKQPWVVVASGASQRSGTDRANLALVRFLANANIPVHLVAHDVADEVVELNGIRIHQVNRPWGFALAGDRLLANEGSRLARRVKALHPNARVLVNGNCAWPDLNWVHYVHHAWQSGSDAGPSWFRWKDRLTTKTARARESITMSKAKLIFANSERTQRHIVDHCGVDERLIRIVHLGADPEWAPPSRQERNAARAMFDLPHDTPVAVFVGGLGHDRRKGMDTLWKAWEELSRTNDWDAQLVIAGGGRELPSWQAQIARSGFGDKIRLIGHTDHIYTLLAAADILVSPVRYESYGLNVQEALCRGVPALVTASAGVAERYTPDCEDMLLPDADDSADLARRLIRWRRDMDGWQRRTLDLSRLIRSYTWRDMAARMVDLAEQ